MKTSSVPATGNKRFNDWVARWTKLAKYEGTEVPDVDDRIERIVKLWQKGIPAGFEREKGRDKRLLDAERRYCRTNDGPESKRRGEHAIEYEILGPSPASNSTKCLGADLVDGINALPLAKAVPLANSGGARIEADMLLLVRKGPEWGLLLVEVKERSNNAWYAVVENLRQMALFQKSDSARNLFHERQPDLALPKSIPATAVVLGPPEFYTSKGAKSAAVGPARRLIERMHEEAQVAVELATWDPKNRSIEQLAAI